ncbi:YbhB/YbcL family Raf kinase inhibitor-like protein [Bradyrhizobium liaoningense]
MRSFGLIIVMGCLAWMGAASAQEMFQVHSPAFEDNGILLSKFAGKNPKNPNCIGDNISPPLSWSGVPAGAKSLAFLMYDQQGMEGLGVSHFVAYGIPLSMTGLAEGEASIPSGKFVGGKNTLGTTVYFGPCPPPGSGQHHYVITLVATDLEPGSLPPGLTQQELLQAIKGHARGAAGIVGRMANP